VKAALIYNPAAGGGVDCGDLLRAVGDELSRIGYGITIIATEGPGSAGAQAAEAVERGAGVVFACGGDGTVHEVLQGLVGTEAALGVIPFGSANALARDLGLSTDPVAAARQHAGFRTRRVPVGRVEIAGSIRFFAVMAGAGPDGALVYRMLAGGKRRLGRFAYYVRAAKLFAGKRFHGFDVEMVRDGETETVRAVEAMVVRVADMGGLFRGLADRSRRSVLESMELRLVIVRPPAWLSLPLWFSSSWVGMQRWNPWVRVVTVDEFRCLPVDGQSVDVQADGEWVGRAPAQVRLVEDGVWLMMPGSD
jgi:diacylglycerol kinase (ATP)